MNGQGYHYLTAKQYRHLQTHLSNLHDQIHTASNIIAIFQTHLQQADNMLRTLVLPESFQEGTPNCIIESIEQYKRRFLLRIFGLPEWNHPHENTRRLIQLYVQRKLHIDVKIDDFVSVTRLGKSFKKGPRPILVEFKSDILCSAIYSQRHKVAPHVTIMEDLIKSRYRTFLAACRKHGRENVTTDRGIIMIRDGQNGIRPVTHITEV